MAGYRYSLASVKVVISFSNGYKANFGGQGSMIGSVTLARKTERFSSEGDATGGFVINETLDRTGTCTISIKQFAPLVSTLTNLFATYDLSSNGDSVTDIVGGITNYGNTENREGFDASITLEGAVNIDLYYMGTLIGHCGSCYLNMPDLELEEDNGTRDFVFECGEVTFEMMDNKQAINSVFNKPSQA